MLHSIPKSTSFLDLVYDTKYKKLTINGNILYLHLRLFMWYTDCSRWSVQTHWFNPTRFAGTQLCSSWSHRFSAFINSLCTYALWFLDAAGELSPTYKTAIPWYVLWCRICWNFKKPSVIFSTETPKPFHLSSFQDAVSKHFIYCNLF